MGRILTIEQYSQYYLNKISSIKTTSVKKIIKEEVQNNARVREFLPLYCAINKKYNDLPIDILEEAITYRKELESFENISELISKYMRSFESHNYLQDRTHIKDEFVKKIKEVMEQKRISTYSLNKDYGINLKIASQIIKGVTPSCSIAKLKELYLKIK